MAWRYRLLGSLFFGFLLITRWGVMVSCVSIVYPIRQLTRGLLPRVRISPSLRGDRYSPDLRRMEKVFHRARMG
jgi:hypothetical protein